MIKFIVFGLFSIAYCLNMVLTSLIISTHYTDNHKFAVVDPYLQVSGREGVGGGGCEGRGRSWTLGLLLFVKRTGLVFRQEFKGDG